ncbi:MAG: 30S ribosomal protein S16 [bacterium]
MLTIRLTRIGRKNSPAYRVVVAEHKRAVQGKIIEILGQMNPKTDPATFNVNEERVNYWLSEGAHPSSVVRDYLVKKGIAKKADLAQPIHKKKLRPKKKKGEEGDEKASEKPEDPSASSGQEKREEVKEEPKADAPKEDGSTSSPQEKVEEKKEEPKEEKKEEPKEVKEEPKKE